MPPPEPLSAALPMIRLPLMTRPGPEPSLSPGTQSTSVDGAALDGDTILDGRCHQERGP